MNSPLAVPLLLIPLLPLVNFIILIFWGKAAPRSLAILSTACLAAATGIAGYLFLTIPDGPPTTAMSADWFFVDKQFFFQFGIMIDGLAATMALIVTFVSLMVHIYSFGYMEKHEHFGRFFAFLALFTSSMLLLVFSSNLLTMFVAWEGVGLCSYFLIGFYFEKPSAAAAGKKAFITTKLGDLGFITAILILLTIGAQTQTFAQILDFESLKTMLAPRNAAYPLLKDWSFIVGLLLFFAAIGKSAQFPLHVWLPDAMEGPSPVSALIHAATMVVAGVYLVARMFFLFGQDPNLALIITLVGVFTAFMAATIALKSYDLKRVLAYSTISQIGYMMAALGLGSAVASMFHVGTHAFFKALLFLAAGSIFHAYHSLEIRRIRRVAKFMRTTSITFAVGALALAGFPYITAGFFSKEAVLSAAYEKFPWAFWVLALTAGLTAFYMFRLIFLTFFNYPVQSVPKRSSGDDNADENHEPHESSSAMTMPLVILAILSVAAGYFGWLLPVRIGGEIPHGGTNVLLTSIAFAIGGILLAWAIYSARIVKAEAMVENMPTIARFLENKWYWDEIYDATVGRLFRAVTWLVAQFDWYIVDDLYHLFGRLSVRAGMSFRQMHSGSVQIYLLTIAIALLILIFMYNITRFS
ncbi:MAG: NADH-quinone oxidoreductase subunit L [Candidatus Brocadiia bacterium]